MSTLAKFGLWQDAQKPLSEPGRTAVEPGKATDRTRADAGLNRVNRENRRPEPSRQHAGKSEREACVHETRARTDHQNTPVHPVHPVQASKSGTSTPVQNAPLPGSPGSAALGPVPGSLQARLTAVGATVNTYGKRASVRAPAGIPLELVREVEARGWAIIPGGRPNDEAEHDTWLAGVPIAELER